MKRFAWFVLGVMLMSLPAPAGATAINDSERVYFASGSAELDDAARRVLDRTFKVMATLPAEIGLTITGHTEEKEVPSGTEAFPLGERRAQAVKDYLVSKGFEPERIRTWSYGWERPQVVGDTSWNRRAVARFWELSGPTPAELSYSSDFYDYETKTAFDRVFFAAGSAELDDTARRVLDRQFREAVGFTRGWGLALTGHADHKEVPGGRQSFALGERRAQAVRDYLVSKGIAPERIRTRSYGWYRSAVPPSVDSLKNRRVVTRSDIAAPARAISTDLFQEDRVFFASGSAELDDAAKRVLDRQFRVVDSYPADLKLTTIGYTDYTEEPSYQDALVLGRRRAQAVKDYLVSKGVAPELIDTMSFGWKHPVVSPGVDSLKNKRVVTKGRPLQ